MSGILYILAIAVLSNYLWLERVDLIKGGMQEENCQQWFGYDVTIKYG